MTKDTNNSAVNHNETKMQLHPCRVYKAVGFDDVILDTTETYCVLGEEWKCKELMVENV